MSAFVSAHAGNPTSSVPFTYVINYTVNQAIDPEFRTRFDTAVPALYHPGSDLRFFGRFGFGTGVIENRHTPYNEYKQQITDYVKFLHQKGVRWITPYLCNQTISGNVDARFGAWEAYDNWDKYAFLNYGKKPTDPINWMQREPSGNLHYNYKRKCFLDRHQDDLQIRYAPCPNNQEWRNFMNSEARHAAQLGIDGFFIDNNIIHCYCQSCQERFQSYLKQKYNPDELLKAFGTRDYSQLTLYHQGDYRNWARSFPEFIPWLERKYPDPDQRRIFFDTADSLTDINIDAAGGGMLFGETSQFLAEHGLSPDVSPTYENIRLANPALQTPVGRLRWAETVTFWCYSIGDQLLEMRQAGREVNPDFFVMPNWGVMQRVMGAIGRAEDGKNVRYWTKGARWQMYEEDSATGIIAPGVVLDYDMELRYAFACGMQAMLLPYTFNDRDVIDVHHAETAASGGSAFVTLFEHPEIRSKYQKFYDAHPELFEGYQSAAKVALAHYFDQSHYINPEHIRQVQALNRFLADQQIPFDHIIETDTDPQRLAQYKVILLPNIVFISDAQVQAFQGFIDQGGTIIVIGETGGCDALCRRRNNKPVFQPRKGAPSSLVQFDNLESALPYRGVYLWEGLQAARSDIFILDFEDERSAKYSRMKIIDEKLGFKRYLEPGPVTAAIENALGRSPHLLQPKAASGIRQTVWKRSEGGHKRIMIHLVNKNVPLAEADGKRLLESKSGLTIHLPCCENEKIATVQYWQPGQTVQQLDSVVSKGGICEIEIPILHAYGIVDVHFE